MLWTFCFWPYTCCKKESKSWCEEVEATCNRNRPVRDTADIEKGYGRMKTRHCQVFEKGLIIDIDGRWKGLQAIIKTASTREIRRKTATEERYCIRSLDIKQLFNPYIRNHWGVEDSLHWILDMVFREDQQRKRDKMAAEKFAIVRKIALNLLKKDTSTIASLGSKHLNVAWNKKYTLALLKF